MEERSKQHRANVLIEGTVVRLLVGTSVCECVCVFWGYGVDEVVRCTLASVAVSPDKVKTLVKQEQTNTHTRQIL